MWEKKSKGCAYIYTREGDPFAIVDRRGYGIKSAMGLSVTYKDCAFRTVEEAKVYADSDLVGVE